MKAFAGTRRMFAARGQNVPPLDAAAIRKLASQVRGNVITPETCNLRNQSATFAYGAGAEYAFTRHFSLRAEYRGLVYKAPNFNLASLNTGSWTQIAQPSAGIAFRF
jgi:opacity protein-like surface antigen